MHTHPEDRSAPPSAQRPTPRAAVSLVLTLARILHRAAVSDSTATALPVLRRLLASGSLQGFTLPELYRQRDKVQRKHVLRMLAIEAGHVGWEVYRQALAVLQPAQLTHFELLRGNAGYPNLWFSTPEQAAQHVAQHGGTVVNVGHQAMVLTNH